MTTQSKELTEFYRAYAEWLDQGAPVSETFRRDYGLCPTLTRFCNKQGWDYRVLNTELDMQFEKAGLRTGFPFRDRPGQYNEEAGLYITYSNPKRIQWVRDHLNSE